MLLKPGLAWPGQGCSHQAYITYLFHHNSHLQQTCRGSWLPSWWPGQWLALRNWTSWTHRWGEGQPNVIETIQISKITYDCTDKWYYGESSGLPWLPLQPVQLYQPQWWVCPRGDDHQTFSTDLLSPEAWNNNYQQLYHPKHTGQTVIKIESNGICRRLSNFFYLVSSVILCHLLPNDEDTLISVKLFLHGHVEGITNCHHRPSSCRLVHCWCLLTMHNTHAQAAQLTPWTLEREVSQRKACLSQKESCVYTTEKEERIIIITMLLLIHT